MEFRGVYILWAFLPVGYLLLCIWVYLRPLFKVAGREKVSQYYPSFLWTAGCLVLAIALDQFGIVEFLFGLIASFGIVEADLGVGMLRFLLYPAVLVGVAQLQRVITGEDSDKKRTLPKSKWR